MCKSLLNLKEVNSQILMPFNIPEALIPIYMLKVEKNIIMCLFPLFILFLFLIPLFVFSSQKCAKSPGEKKTVTSKRNQGLVLLLLLGTFLCCRWNATTRCSGKVCDSDWLWRSSHLYSMNSWRYTSSF